jgi:hypothetical protein
VVLYPEDAVAGELRQRGLVRGVLVEPTREDAIAVRRSELAVIDGGGNVAG